MEIIEEAFLILFVIDGSVPYPTDFDPRAMDKIKGKDILIREQKATFPKSYRRNNIRNPSNVLKFAPTRRKTLKKSPH